MRLLIMGPPGAGKGTQGVGIAAYHGIPAISTGEIFRAHVTKDTPLGREVKRLIDKGDYVPDAITEEIVAERLSEPDAANGYLLDGFPRTIHQVTALDRILDRSGTRLDAVLSLTLDEDAVVERIMRRAAVGKRADDTEETARHRMAVYTAATEPLLATYRRRGLLVEVDGDGTIEEVAQRMVAALDSQLTHA